MVQHYGWQAAMIAVSITLKAALVMPFRLLPRVRRLAPESVPSVAATQKDSEREMHPRLAWLRAPLLTKVGNAALGSVKRIVRRLVAFSHDRKRLMDRYLSRGQNVQFSGVNIMDFQLIHKTVLLHTDHF